MSNSPANGSGRYGRNINQNLSSSCPTPPVPIQAIDATDRDKNRPLVTSITGDPMFSTGGPGTPTHQIPTTSLMDLDNERMLRDRLRGAGSRLKVVPRYIEYANNTVRQQSFANWPTHTQQQIARLIIFGFYYTGQADLVRCFQCGIGLKDWSPGVEPLLEHVRHSPNCSFLQQHLGDELLGTYRVNLAKAQQINETASSHGLQDQTDHYTQDAKARQPMVFHPDRAKKKQRLATFSQWPHKLTQPPEKLADAGLFYSGTNDICICFTCGGGLHSWGNDDDPWIKHARWFSNCSYVRDEKGQEFIDLALAAMYSTQATDATERDTNRPLVTSNTPPEIGITQGNITESEERNRSPTSQDRAGRFSDIMKCKRCQINNSTVMCLPCTHLSLCERCSEQTSLCPTCKRPVNGRVRSFNVD